MALCEALLTLWLLLAAAAARRPRRLAADGYPGHVEATSADGADGTSHGGGLRR